MEIWKIYKISKTSVWEISSDGRVKKNNKINPHRIINSGYYFQTMIGLIHRAVAISFLPNPENKPQVNHINGNKLDCRIENLEWTTRLENMQHAVNKNLIARGEKVGSSKLTKDDVAMIKIKIHQGQKDHLIAEQFGVCRKTISHIRTGRNWFWV